MKRILLIEDELPIAQLLKVYLERNDFSVLYDLGDGDVIQNFLNYNPSLVLLDLMLPQNDGLEILKQIRQYGSCPVIILTARGSVPERLAGLGQGADDYITKPFDPEEVVARVQAVLRRSSHLEDNEIIRLGHLVINFTTRTASFFDELIPLSPRDWGLLAFLGQHPNQCFTREQLLDSVWGMNYDGADRAVDASIKRIRQHLRDWSTNEGEIKTVRGMGYMLYVN
ncbi:response regulator transcription factor [Psychrobacillus sp. INOP01]|uniref:response regulator transcription factor n=1 Tax=Psychrobacillus sp. INOP01 TaxID=2829187 RepID=UPI001BAA4A1A|nr:response regulator transcription factor [Psychrobacillus sp. INOP01]QUG43449.1 response regulator transcription factor [Psychrobacillus sp. INOP01]